MFKLLQTTYSSRYTVSCVAVLIQLTAIETEIAK